MPYITARDKKRLAPALGSLLDIIHDNIHPGFLNYIITKIMIKASSLSYARLNELIGVLECCKLELYRRLVAKYEDEKIRKNGDVY